MATAIATPESSTRVPLQTGYDLPLYGIDNGQFLSLHVPAFVWSCISVACAVTVIVMSFYQNGAQSYFRWNKGLRLVVYLEICDANFSLCAALGRLQIILTEDHVRPPWLCTVYSFWLGVSMISQALMVNVIALNAFFLMYRGLDFNFGRFDYRILLYSYGIPFCLCIYSASTNQLGPNGTMCSVDAVRSKVSGIITSSIMILVFITNTFLYIITWIKINRQIQTIGKYLESTPASKKGVSQAAKTMSMFVFAFFIQWLPVTIFCIWKVFENHPPILLMIVMVSVSNCGGFLNGCVYLIIRWKKLKPMKSDKNLMRGTNEESIT